MPCFPTARHTMTDAAAGAPVVDLGTDVIVEEEEEDELQRAAARQHGTALEDPEPGAAGEGGAASSGGPGAGAVAGAGAGAGSGAAESDAEADVDDSALKKKGWVGTGAMGKWFAAVGKDIPIDRLGWDLKLEHGQTRAVDDTHVDHLVNSLILRPPREPVKITVWENQVDKKYYIMSGQHLSRAVQRVKEERQKQGLKLEPWHSTVRADVLKFDTPKATRMTLAGAENASTRIQRVTTVSECLRNLMADTTADTLQDKVLRAVEQSGLNVTDSSPVCNHQERHACR